MRRARGTIRNNIAYALLQAFYWCAFCSYFSYLVAYLLKNGYSRPLIGLILTMLSALSVAVPLVAGYLVDFAFPIRRFVAVVMGLAIPAAFLLRFSVASVPLSVLSIACLGILERGQSSVLDSWAVKLRGRGVDLRYGPTRAFASLSFAFTALLLGGFFARVGLDKLFYVHAAFAAGCLVSALFLDDVPVKGRDHADHLPVRSALRLLAGNPRYRLLVVSITLCGIASITNVTFMPMMVDYLGGTSADLGACLFVMALSEMTVMLLFQRLARRFAVDRMLAVALFFIVVRVAVVYFVPSIPWLIAAQTLQAMSFGLYLPSLLLYLGRITDPRMQATAVTFAVAAGEGVAGIVGNSAGSALLALSDMRTVYLFFGCVALAGFLTFVAGQASIVRKEAEPPPAARLDA